MQKRDWLSLRLALEVSAVEISLYFQYRLGIDFKQIPSVQEEVRIIRKTYNLTVDIAKELNDCCEEIKALLNELQNLINEAHTATREYLWSRIIRKLGELSL